MTTTSTRRELLGYAAAATALITAVPGLAHGQKPPTSATARLPPQTAPGSHVPKPLPFDAGALTGISKEMITSHHDKNYAGTVTNLNKLELELARAVKETPPFQVAALRERELSFTNSLILHEHYFANLGGDGKRGGEIDRALSAGFGSAAVWEQAFRAAATGLGGGSGWAILYMSGLTGDLRIIGSGNHTQALAFGAPLLVLDMYEHAYAIDYGAEHAKYIDAFFRNVRWDVVDARLLRAKSSVAALMG